MAKLVEILARELKDWHNSWPALGQASDGSLHREPFLGGHTNFCLTLASDYSDAIVTRAEWQAAVDALKGKHSASEELVSDYVEAQSDRYTKAWDGVGLPPVGTDCEFMHPGVDHWVRVKVYAYPDATHMLGVTDDELWSGESNKACRIRIDEHLEFRPIRTPEQIAAEERRKGIAGIAEDLGDKTWGVTIQEWLYDLGYRKQEPK